MQPTTIRVASEGDAAALLAIYAPFVSTPVTFEEQVPSEGEFRQRIRTILAGYPYLVAQGEGGIIGYAYAHPQAERAAYGWNAELSVYLAPGARGLGLGTILYQALLQLLAAQGMKCAYARVTSPNKASERLHEKLGFMVMGIQENAGYTCGGWRDVTWLTKPLGAFGDSPQPPKRFGQLDEAQVAAVLREANGQLAAQVEPR